MENNKIHDDDEMEIDLLSLLYALKEKIWMILLVGLLFACGAAGFTKFFMTPTYTSTSKMLVLTKETTVASLADLQMGSQLTKDYAVLINTRKVLTDVIENLGLEMDYQELRECITIENEENTRILSISVEQPTAEAAQKVVNELSSVASAFIGEQMEVTPPKIIETGELPVYKTGPSMKKNVLLGMLAGMMLVCGIVVVIEILNDSVQNEDDIQRYLGIPTLAVVPDKGLKRGKPVKNNKRRKAR